MKAYNQNRKTRFATVACLALGAIATGCNSTGSTGSNMIKSVAISTSTDASGNSFANAKLDVDTGNLSLVSVNLPILNPKNSSETFGTLALSSALNGTSSEIDLSVNLTQMIHLAGIGSINLCDSHLPNGTALPVAGLSNSTIVCVPVGQTGARVYLAFGNGTGLLGVALPFKQLDNLGQYVPGVNVFNGFINNGFTGTAGVFTGSSSAQTGFGVFADIAKLIPSSLHNVIGGLSPSAPSTVSVGESIGTTLQQGQLSFPTVRPSKAKLRKVMNAFGSVSQHGGELELY